MSQPPDRRFPDEVRAAVEARRAILTPRPNPGPRRSYHVTLEADIGSIAGRPTIVTVDYVPDRGVLEAAAFSAYARGLGGRAWAGPEDLGVTVLDDINNELVPRWVRVSVSCASACKQGDADADLVSQHAVVLEDCQPTWRANAPPAVADTPARRPDRRG